MSDGLTHWQQKVMELAQGHTVAAVRAMTVKQLKDTVSFTAASAAGAGAAAGGEVRPLRARHCAIVVCVVLTSVNAAVFTEQAAVAGAGKIRQQGGWAGARLRTEGVGGRSARP